MAAASGRRSRMAMVPDPWLKERVDCARVKGWFGRRGRRLNRFAGYRCTQSYRSVRRCDREILATPLPLIVSVSTTRDALSRALPLSESWAAGSVDRSGHARGVAAQAQCLGVVARLEDHDSRVGPAARWAQVVRAVAAQADAAIGSTRRGEVAAGIEDQSRRSR